MDGQPRARTIAVTGIVMLMLAVHGGCGSDHANSSNSGKNGTGTLPDGGTPPGPTCTDCTPAGPMTFTLPSPAGATLWTTPTMEKVLHEATPPANPGDAISISAAKNEFEPFQLVVHADADTNVTLAMPPFGGPGSIPRIEVRRVEYVTIAKPSDASSIPSSAIPDPLVPSTFGKSEPAKGGQNQPFWITVYVPKDAPAGDYTTTLTVTVGGAAQAIPVKLHVFDFAIPDKIGFDGNWNASFNDLGGGASLDVVEDLKTFFFEHRLVPSSVAWPAGLNYNGGVDYDCASGTFEETSNAYDISQLGPEYIDGTGWNGVGFPSFEIMQFVDNSTPRPQTFCNVDRGPDAAGTPEYNAAWSKLLAAIDAELVKRNWTEKGYYYVQNEPQNQADYDTAATLAALTKAAAPHLKIAVSEEPKPEIAENPKANGTHYDLWWADLSFFNPDYAAKRQALGESVWWYFLYGDQPPHFNPITIDHPGIESRVPFFSAYNYGIAGFAYYSLTGWGDDPYHEPRTQGTNQNGDGFLLYPPQNGELVTSIRWELLRDGEEDWEYLQLLGNCQASSASVASSTTSFTHDADALQNLRNQLGLRLEGKVNGCPVLSSQSSGSHPRADVYIDFQDPAGDPKADPLSVNGHTWQKIGWDAYDAKKGFGWAGPNIGNADIMKYEYLADAPVDELQRSIIYDDYGRTDTFNYDIANGSYDVTVSIGWSGKTYSQQKVVIEGQPLFDNVETNPTTSYLVKTITVNVTDGNVTMEAGQQDQYTMLNWMSIVPK